jgi:uncharacterized protein with PQ loop repeat
MTRGEDVLLAHVINTMYDLLIIYNKIKNKKIKTKQKQKQKQTKT